MEELDDQDIKWEVKHEPIFQDGKLILVHTALTVDGVTRTDVGVPSNQDPIKGAYSDGLKRAAVQFGVARELYELPQVFVPLKGKVPAVKPTFNTDSGRWEVKEPGYVIYPDEDAARNSLDEVMTGIKALITAKPALKELSGPFVESNKLSRDKVEDMEKLLDYLTEEAGK